MDNIRMILLDIGGVLIEFIGAKKLLEWMGGDIDKDKLNYMWSNSSSVCMFETGKCDSKKFAESIVTELKLPILPGEFVKEFLCFPKGFYPEAESLLKEISKNYMISSFSNTNSLQWDRLSSEYGIDKFFHKNFLSFKMGLMKPNKDAYIHVIKELACEPEQILFFDDSQANVSMGNEVGMRAYRVLGTSGLKAKLDELNILK